MFRFLAYLILGIFWGTATPVMGWQAPPPDPRGIPHHQPTPPGWQQMPPANPAAGAPPSHQPPPMRWQAPPMRNPYDQPPPPDNRWQAAQIKSAGIPRKPPELSNKPGKKKIFPIKNTKEANNKKKKLDLKPADLTPLAPAIPVPATLRPLTKKTILIDARRLGEHKFTETIRYIKEHPNIRLKLQNMTIDADSIIPLMKGFKEANVIDQIRDIGFVMLPGPKNQVLNKDAFISKVLPYLGHLEGISLSCLGVSDDVVAALPKRMPHLKHISLFGVGITDATITNLAKELPNLVKVHLTNTSLTTKGLRELVKSFPYLRAIGISGHNLKDKDFEALKEEAQNLHAFSAIGQTFKDMNTIISLLGGLPKLHTLDLSETNVTDQVAKSIPVTVKSLDISDTRITYEGVKDIAKHPDLTTLKMNHLKNIGENELNLIIENQPGLCKFYCAGVSLSDTTVMRIILKLIKLTDITLIPPSDSKWMMSESIAEALAQKMVKLQYLRIPAKRLPENLRLKLERDIPNLRIEYEG